MIEVISAGMASTLQDRGRPGLAHLGVPGSGAVDPDLAALVNRLVGNPPEAAVIETCGGLSLRALSPLLVAMTGELASRSMRSGESVVIRSGAAGRLWHYVAVRGGFAVPPVLGSRSTDTLSSIGPPSLTDGTILAVGPDPETPVTTELTPLKALGDRVRCSAGPRADWFDDSWATVFAGQPWTVTTSSRVGVRLAPDGQSVRRRVTAELPSEGLVRGAIQIPPDGSPVMMLADHPTTGGYPVIAVVHPDDVALVAQHPAGTQVRFTVSG